MTEIDHMVDLKSFIENETYFLSDYFEGKPNNSYSQQILDAHWMEEQILLLFSQWTTGITRTVLRQNILNQARTSRSRQHVKPDANHHPVIHGVISKINIYKCSDNGDKTRSAAVIHIKQEGYELFVKAALHGAQLPFIGKFIMGGRKIHFANIRFSNDCLIPNQLCVIDLKKTKEDISFIKKCPPFLISKINDENCPDSLLLQVDRPTKRGIRFTDGSEDSIELLLDEERMALKQLLNFGDVILFYKPWAVKMDDDKTYLTYGPNSVIFRVPVIVESKPSQISQRSLTSLTQDGLSFRNSSACTSINGTVLEIYNQFDDSLDTDNSKWTNSKLVISTIIEKVTIDIRVSSDTPYEVMRIVASLRPNHFVWIFGLIMDENRNISFTPETTIYNTSQLYSIIASNIVVPRTLNIIENYKTFVTKAVIINVPTCDVKYRHKICHALLRSNSRPQCPICQTRMRPSKDMDEDFLIKLEIDDMSCDPVTVYGNGSKFSFWPIKPYEWKRADEKTKQKLIFSLIGRECVFVLSKASEQEFCGFGDEFSVWRIDQCIRPVGDIEREVRRIAKWHMQLDKEELSQSQHVF